MKSSIFIIAFSLCFNISLFAKNTFKCTKVDFTNLSTENEAPVLEKLIHANKWIKLSETKRDLGGEAIVKTLIISPIISTFKKVNIDAGASGFQRILKKLDCDNKFFEYYEYGPDESSSYMLDLYNGQKINSDTVFSFSPNKKLIFGSSYTYHEMNRYFGGIDELWDCSLREKHGCQKIAEIQDWQLTTKIDQENEIGWVAQSVNWLNDLNFEVQLIQIEGEMLDNQMSSPGYYKGCKILDHFKSLCKISENKKSVSCTKPRLGNNSKKKK